MPREPVVVYDVCFYDGVRNDAIASGAEVTVHVDTAAVVMMADVETDNRVITAVGCIDAVLCNAVAAFVVFDRNPVGETGKYPSGIAVFAEAIPDRDV